MVLKFHHIGVVTNNLTASISVYRFLGYMEENNKFFNDPIQQVVVYFMIKSGHPRVELIAPMSESSPAWNIIKKMNSKPYHCCYEVEEMGSAIDKFRKEKFLLIQKPLPAVAFNNQKVCFLYNNNIGLIELLENNLQNK